MQNHGTILNRNPFGSIEVVAGMNDIHITR
jgi:hypothetical protein